MLHPVEPFKIKVVEPIYFTTREEREKRIAEVHYNLFFLGSKWVTVDLLTDSGTSALSEEQWANLMRGDEAYSGAKSYERFKRAVEEFTGMPFVLPVHQGRAAENIIASLLIQSGDIVVANTFFDTTRANFEVRGAKVLDLPTDEAFHIEEEYPFKGNMDIEALENLIKKEGKRVKIIGMTITNNRGGGQPVSMENLRRVVEIARENNVLLLLDACRIAENAYFIKEREEGYRNKKISEIIREIFSHFDIAYMSAKKDGLANIGGFIATKDEKLMEKFYEKMVLLEGFPTYGGLSGREMETIAIGLKEVVREEYLRYRIEQVRYLAKGFENIGVKVLKPPGGHAVFVDAGALLPHIPKENFPGQALAIALYIEGGVRTFEAGSLTMGKDREAKYELLRFAIPRRVYTQSHLDYVVEVLKETLKRRDSVRGVKIIYEPPHLRHFLAKFELVT
jgi:tryptophanase